MCVAVICKKRKPTEKEIAAMWKANSDGGGIIKWSIQGGVKYIKGIDTLTEMQKLVSTWSLPMALHFRIASSGGVKRTLTHPFLVTTKNENPLVYKGRSPVLMHNGHSVDSEKYFMLAHLAAGINVPGGDWNDSRCAAWMVARSGDRVLEAFSGVWAVIRPNGVSQYGSWEKHKGLSCSNKYWTYTTYGGSNYQYQGYDEYSHNRFNNKTNKWEPVMWDKQQQNWVFVSDYCDTSAEDLFPETIKKDKGDDEPKGLTHISHYGKHFTEELDEEI